MRMRSDKNSVKPREGRSGTDAHYKRNRHQCCLSGILFHPSSSLPQACRGGSGCARKSCAGVDDFRSAVVVGLCSFENISCPLSCHPGSCAKSVAGLASPPGSFFGCFPSFLRNLEFLVPELCLCARALCSTAQSLCTALHGVLSSTCSFFHATSDVKFLIKLTRFTTCSTLPLFQLFS